MQLQPQQELEARAALREKQRLARVQRLTAAAPAPPTVAPPAPTLPVAPTVPVEPIVSPPVQYQPRTAGKPPARRPVAKQTTPTRPPVGKMPQQAPIAQAEPTKNLLPYVKNFFGNRNGISFEQAQLREGINYTNETLSYMTPANKADKITRFIIDSLPYRPFVLFECCSGIGGNTLSFLDSPAISVVYSFEKNPERREMLRRNIAAYKQQAKSVVDNNNEGFQGVPADFSGSVLYFDPPWLPPEIPGHLSYPRQYIRKGMRIGPYTIEEWMQRLPHVGMVVLRVPPPLPEEGLPGYELDPVEGWNCTINDTLIDKSRVFVCKSEAGIRAGTEAVPQTLAQKDDEAKWKRELQTFMYNFLRRAFPENMVNAFLAPEVFSTWMKAFTHESFDTNFNYEELELLGDDDLKLAFADYLMQRYPGIPKNYISALADRYMSKQFQRTLSIRLGFSKLIRTLDTGVNIHILEDVFESVFGALFMVSRAINPARKTLALKKVNLSYANDEYQNCFILLAIIFDDVDFNMEYVYGRSKTQIKEMFEKFTDWGKPVEEVTTSDLGVRVIIRMTLGALNYLREHGIVAPEIIGDAVSNTKKLAVHDAYDDALENLNRLGINRQWVRTEKEDREFNSPNLQPYVGKARDRLIREGYETMYFFIPRTGTNQTGCVVQLIGVRPNGKTQRLASVAACDQTGGKTLVLREYAEGA